FAWRRRVALISRPMPKAVRDYIRMRIDRGPPALERVRMDNQNEAVSPRLLAQCGQSFRLWRWPMRRAAKSRLDESFQTNRSGILRSRNRAHRREVTRIELGWQIFRFRFVNNVVRVRCRGVFRRSQRHVTAHDPDAPSATAEIRMQRRRVEPRQRRRSQIKIDNGREAEREVRLRELRAVRLQQFRMLLERVVIERALVAD